MTAGTEAPLRIIVVIPGRPEERTMVFSRRQARAYHEAHNAAVEVFFLETRMSPAGLWALRRRFKTLVERFKPDVVHAHYGTVTALFSVLFSPVPVVITYHGSDLNHTPHDGFFRDLLGRTMSQFAALGAAGIICVSTELRDNLWWRRKRVQILPMGVELRRYIPVHRDEARQRLGWQGRPKVVIFNATSPARKRLDIAQDVERRLQQRGVPMELHLLQGGTTQEEMPVLLSAADALLMCSNSEGSPTMVKEAMACDLPVVTNDVGDVRDRLDGVTPGAITTQAPRDLADALEAVLAEGRRSNGRALAVRNKADAESLDAATYELLRSVSVGKRPPSSTASRAVEAALVLMAVALPLLPDLLPLSMVLLVLCRIWQRTSERGPRPRWSWTSPLPWMALFYGMHLLGLGWTRNMEFAGLDLGIKTPLLVFPLLYLLGGTLPRLDRVYRAFVSANVFAVLVCLVRAMYRSGMYMAQVKPDEVLSSYTASVPFFASEFALFLHPTYMAMYLSLALVLLFRTPAMAGWGRGRALAIAAVLVLGVVLCASKAGWLVLLVLGALPLVGHWRDPAVRRRTLAGLAAALVLGTGLFVASPFVHERVMQVVNTFRAEAPARDAANSTDDRRLVWSAARTLIAAHPLTGVGTGDVKDELLRTYAERGYTEPLRKRLNAHDQYLNSAVALGLGAALLLVLLVAVPSVRAWRQGEVVFPVFLLLNGLNWTVESMLEVQAGVMFLAFFGWLFTAVLGERG